ncbi:hypothetical protein B7494_g2251 [Chlorociboria aeruginascens]|nr:hypothetical protein B7494_g2251 [Chlorociboria aeruginascens]
MSFGYSIKSTGFLGLATHVSLLALLARSSSKFRSFIPLPIRFSQRRTPALPAATASRSSQPAKSRAVSSSTSNGKDSAFLKHVERLRGCRTVAQAPTRPRISRAPLLPSTFRATHTSARPNSFESRASVATLKHIVRARNAAAARISPPGSRKVSPSLSKLLPSTSKVDLAQVTAKLESVSLASSKSAQPLKSCLRDPSTSSKSLRVRWKHHASNGFNDEGCNVHWVRPILTNDAPRVIRTLAEVDLHDPICGHWIEFPDAPIYAVSAVQNLEYRLPRDEIQPTVAGFGVPDSRCEDCLSMTSNGGILPTRSLFQLQTVRCGTCVKLPDTRRFFMPALEEFGEFDHLCSCPPCCLDSFKGWDHNQRTCPVFSRHIMAGKSWYDERWPSHLDSDPCPDSDSSFNWDLDTF